MRVGLRCQHLNISNQYEGVGFIEKPVVGGYYNQDIGKKLSENHL